MKIERFFNTAGPIKWDIHYYIDPLKRIDLKRMQLLLQQGKYFILNAPHQTGKTSYLMALRNYLNEEGKYKALYTSVQEAQAARGKVKDGMWAIIQNIADDALIVLGDSFLEEHWREVFKQYDEYSALETILSLWCQHSEKPIVLFIDDVHTLIGETMISFLQQIRTGYRHRGALFPQSIILCGVRDIRHDCIQMDTEAAEIKGGSIFNIKVESLDLPNLTLEDIKCLYEMHTNETGQRFHPDVFPLVWELSAGQPWLVNALADRVTSKAKYGLCRQKEISVAMIQQAKEDLIQKRDIHLDQLTKKLGEDRVKRLLTPILTGLDTLEHIPEEDIDYVAEFGLIKRSPNLAIANRIYQEIIPRQLTYSEQMTIQQEASWYLMPDGRLNMDQLLTAFQEFFRQHYEGWVKGFPYPEAGALLLLQAFLARIVNDSGRVEREYGLGRMRTDLLVLWPLNVNPDLPKDHYARFEQVQQVVIELKLQHTNTLATTIQTGLAQTVQYMDKCGTPEGYLLIFNSSPTATWEEKIFKKEETVNGIPIKIYGL